MRRWVDPLQTRAEGWTILVRLMVGLVVFFPEGIQKLVFPEILGGATIFGYFMHRRSPTTGSGAWRMRRATIFSCFSDLSTY